MPINRQVIFVSDTHFGVPNHKTSLARERSFCKFLDHIEAHCTDLYLLGDIFDFWFSYKHVVPRGFVRVLGKLASLSDKGVKIHYFIGNHDMWVFDYFEKELGFIMYQSPIEIEINGKRLLIGHGDGLGHGDRKYKFIKHIFRCRLNQFLFAMLHPRWGIGVAKHFSRKSRLGNGMSDKVFLGIKNERLINYCIHQEQISHHDYYIFGHRHLKADLMIAENARYIKVGDWVNERNYAIMDGEDISLKTFVE